jgi:hypothetical protein
MNIDLADLGDFADQVAAAADLDEDARRTVAFDLEVGDPEWAICDAVLATKSPLPLEMLQRIRRDLLTGKWFSGDTRQLIADAIDRQERQHVA